MFHNQRQRRRWLSAQWVYAIRCFVPGIKQLLGITIDYATKTCQSLLLSRVLLMGIVTAMATPNATRSSSLAVVVRWVRTDPIAGLPADLSHYQAADVGHAFTGRFLADDAASV